MGKQNTPVFPKDILRLQMEMPVVVDALFQLRFREEALEEPNMNCLPPAGGNPAQYNKANLMINVL